MRTIPPIIKLNGNIYEMTEFHERIGIGYTG